MTIPLMIACSSILDKSMNRVDSPTEDKLFMIMDFVLKEFSVNNSDFILQPTKTHLKFMQLVDSVQDRH